MKARAVAQAHGTTRAEQLWQENTPMHRFLTPSVLAALFGLGLAAACSSKSSSSTASDTSDAMVASSEASSVVGNEACDALIAYDARCSDTAEMHGKACVDGRKTTCDQVTRTMGDDYRAAVVSCFTNDVACGDTDACVSGKLATVHATPAMLKVRDDYCATCGGEVGPKCKDDFFGISNDNGNGDGFLVLQVSDDLARAIDAKCTGTALHPADFDATSCRDGFLYCATGEQQNASPGMPDTCYPPAPPDDGGA